MPIPSLALALSTGFSNGYFHSDYTPKHSQNSSPDMINLHDDNAKVHLDQKLNLNLTVAFPEFVDVCLVLRGKLDSYSWIVTGWAEGVIVYLNDTIRIYAFISDRLFLKRIIKISNSQFKLTRIVHLINVAFNNGADGDWLLYITDDNNVNLMDLASGLLLQKIKLPFEFIKLEHISGSNLVSLFGTSSYYSVLEFDHLVQRLILYPLVYLNFQPVTHLLTNKNELFIVGGNGQYEIYHCTFGKGIVKEKQQYLHLNVPLGCPSYGKIVSINRISTNSAEKENKDKYIADAENCWLVLQKYGYVLFKLTTKGRVINITHSPLESISETFFHLKNSFAIIMNNGDILHHENGISKKINGCKAIYIFKSLGMLWGMFRVSDSFILKSLNLQSGNWSDQSYPLVKVNGESNLTKLITEEFDIVSNRSVAYLKDKNGSIKCKFNGFDSPLQKVINLSFIIQSEFNSHYLLVVDTELNMEILEFAQNFTQLKRRLAVKYSSGIISNVFYFENLNILQFIDDSGNSKSVNMNSMNICIPNNTFENLSKIVVFQLDDLNLNLNSNEVLTLTDLIFADEFKLVPLEIILEDPLWFEKLKIILSNWESHWIGITSCDSNQLVFYHLIANEFDLSPELLLLYIIVSPDRVDSICHFLKAKPPPNKFIDKLSLFCLNSNPTVANSAHLLLKSLLSPQSSSDQQRLNILFANTLSLLNKANVSEMSNICGILILSICISENPNFYTKDVSRVFMKFLTGYLPGLDKTLSSIIFSALGKIGLLLFENYASDCFDIFQFFKQVLELRSKFITSNDKRSFDGLTICTNYLNSLFEKESITMCIIMGTILSSDKFNANSKISVVDYLNYLFLEKVQWLGSIDLLLLLNSLVVYLDQLYKLHILHKKSDDSIWEHLNLILNIMINCLPRYLNVTLNSASHEPVSNIIDLKYILTAQLNIRIVLLLDVESTELDYCGVIFSLDKNQWHVTLLKNSRKGLKLLDGVEDSESSIESVKKVLGHTQRYQLPCFSTTAKQFALFDFERLDILIWNFNEKLENDAVSVELLVNDSIPLKVPDFHLLFIQIIWNELQAKKRFQSSHLMSLLSAFQLEMNENSSKVAQPSGKVCFGDLLNNYKEVFDSIGYEHLGLEWGDDNRFMLKLHERIIFVYSR
ncbi:hypothetical protein DAMA08_043150 [Martiniozyma asiatica (nom. inval.)]|nr:hypothetical protein DAMA08_043150 [Martiniozyma asiatica]